MNGVLIKLYSYVVVPLVRRPDSAAEKVLEKLRTTNLGLENTKFNL